MDWNRSNGPTMRDSSARSHTGNDQQSPTTYAELRQMNRRGQRPKSNVQPPPSQSFQDSSSENPPSDGDLVGSFDAPVAKSKPKANKYGDAWEN